MAEKVHFEVMANIASVEALEAGRPLEETGWKEGFEAAAHGIFGAGALDFHDKTVEGQPVILMEAGDMAKVSAITVGVLGDLSSRELVDRAEEDMPPSFGESAAVKFTGELQVREIKRPEGPKPVLVAKILPGEPVADERASLMGTVERSAKKPTIPGTDVPVNGRYRLPWVGSGPQNKIWMRLAVLLEESYYTSFDARMLRLAELLPPEARVARGSIVPSVGYYTPILGR